jgi:hypothetical protein
MTDPDWLAETFAQAERHWRQLPEWARPIYTGSLRRPLPAPAPDAQQGSAADALLFLAAQFDEVARAFAAEQADFRATFGSPGPGLAAAGNAYRDAASMARAAAASAAARSGG